jgi:pimeloyl-ACP methyl ester carboxylesterase
MSKRNAILLVLAILMSTTLFVFWQLGYFQRPNFISNFEEEEYGQENPFIQPTIVKDGLAIYRVGDGEPVLLFPYPHAHTVEPMAQGDLAEALLDLGFSVVTFDVSGAYHSTREPEGTMEEMLECADQTLSILSINEPVPVVGHSMGGLSALAFAIERPEKTEKLVLIGAVAGFPSAAKHGLPFSAFGPLDAEYWQIIVWGTRISSGRADLALHKRLQNVMGSTLFHNRSYFEPIAIEKDDHGKGVPIRMIWSKNMWRKLDYSDRLDEVKAETVVLVGRFDKEAPVECSLELNEGISHSDLIIFEYSGHLPFIEQAGDFRKTMGDFLNTSA